MGSVLITGANGFIGCNLVRHFGEAGHQVIALDRSEPDELIRRISGCRIGSCCLRPG